jgi:hypothetical protein
MRLVLLVLLGAAMAAITYLLLERMGRRAVIPMLLRTVAWTTLLVLLSDLSCPARPLATAQPLVLLDRSLSLEGDSARFRVARDSATRLGQVLSFGDERPPDDTAARGRSLLEPALVSALASGRPVTVVSDGEIEDAGAIPADLLRQADVVLFPRPDSVDVAFADLSGPERVTAGDTAEFAFQIRATPGFHSDSLRLELREGGRLILRRNVTLQPGTERHGTLPLPTAGLGAGEHLITAALAGAGDHEPRDDARQWLFTVDATPGLVLAASPPDFDSRALYRALKDVAHLPVRGFVRLEPGRWRDIATLKPVAESEVRQAADRADILVAKGGVKDLVQGARARGLLRWSSGEAGESLIDGDWYLSAQQGGPLAGALYGFPLDSFPPATRMATLPVSEGDWTALSGQLGRRGAERPALIGHVAGNRREIVVAVDGLWRWAFRGGSSEAAYRSLVGASVSWLLGGADSSRAGARPARPVVERGRPVVFERTGGATAGTIAISLDGAASVRDTLRFDGAGHARLYLSPGRYRYRLVGGGEGAVVVEPFSAEWWPRGRSLHAQRGDHPVSRESSNARRLVWLFLLCVAALAGEWFVRRRLGLR